MDRVEQIFKSNSKIPFMQSKDILRLGYEFGNADCREELLKDFKSKLEKSTQSNISEEQIETSNNKKNKKNKRNADGMTSKEMIEYAEREIELNKDIKNKIKEAKLEVINGMLTYRESHTFIETYDYVKSMKNSI